MVFVPARARAHRPARLLLVLAVALTGFSATTAQAAGERRADPSLSLRSISTNGTGSMVTTVQTDALRGAVPGGAPNILLIGTGVQRSLFPATLHDVISGDITDPHGYGTLAASALLQLLPDATITSTRVRSYDAAYDLLRMDDLASALRHAHDERARYDLVLLAFPPQGALDPIAHLIGHGDNGGFGNGMELVVEALLSNPNGIAAIPADRAVRAEVFEGLNQRQRDAVERYANQAAAWNEVLDAVAALDSAGVPIVAPAGDYTRTEGKALVSLPTQTTFGLAAHPSVITVGATYMDGGAIRVSPTSGRGPTLDLGTKPDLVAPADMMVMLPGDAHLPWPDDSLRTPLQVLRWAKAATPPTPCPSVTGAYRCVLQGSSMVSASVVAANLASAAASDLTGTGGSADDDEILRGLAWSHASRTSAATYGSNDHASVWEQGAGVFGGLRGIDLDTTPVALRRADLGEVGWNQEAERTVALWEGAAPALATASITGFTGPDVSGATITTPYADDERLRVAGDAYEPRITAAGGRYQGGVYTGRLLLASGGEPVALPVTLTQGLPLDFKVSYAYNELQAGGIEGERVEDASVVLFAGTPSNLGLIGTAFKNLSGKAFKNAGGDPTNNIMIRYGVTKNSFTDPSVPAADHGTGRIASVPPGFYKIHLLTDHGIDARQRRGRPESLGVRLGSFGSETGYVPGSDVLLGAVPPCDAARADGPLPGGCTQRSGEVDPETGFCTAGDREANISFNVYCGRVSFATSSAVVSRAVHLIEHAALAPQSEWTACGVDVPVDGKAVDLASLSTRAEDCAGNATVPTSWSFDPGAKGCLSDEERAAFPNGHPTDVTATYRGAAAPGMPGRNFPAAVLNYRFKLPQPNTYTTAGLALSYVADNAIVAIRFVTGDDRLNDASTSVLVADEPDVSVTPAIPSAGTKGSAFNEWAVMSANATSGMLSIIVIPTAWVRPDLNPALPIAQVELCDVALRVATFAKQSYGPAHNEGVPTQFFPVVDQNLLDQIDPATSRVRPVFDADTGRFDAAGTETESLSVAVHIPKNTTTSSSATRHVLSPRGGPAYLSGARAWADGARGADVLPAGFRTHDPRYGVQRVDCAARVDAGNADPTCRLWEGARTSTGVIAEIAPAVSFNGRFAGVLALDHDTLRRGDGDIAFQFADADDDGAFDAHWARAGRFRVSDFYDDAVPFQLAPMTGTLRIVRNGKGEPVVRVDAFGIAGVHHTISSPLE